MNERPPWSLRDDLLNAGRGFAMGAADIIPGVSGGTVALILGIYARLVGALSRFDAELLGLVKQRQWRAALAHVDARFILSLLAGIALGIGSLAGVMHYLLDQHGLVTWSVLFGLILASGILVAVLIERWSAAAWAALAAGTLSAYWIVGLLPAVPPDGFWYVFLCGVVAICAMILPGISGAFILVLLGMYFQITGVLRDLLGGNFSAENLITVTIFVTGCAVGLLTFCKILRWFLEHCYTAAMGALCGFMFGSLRKIWPFKEQLSPEALLTLGIPADKIEQARQYRLGPNRLPDFGELAVSLACIALGLAVVFALDRMTRTQADETSEPGGDAGTTAGK